MDVSQVKFRGDRSFPEGLSPREKLSFDLDFVRDTLIDWRLYLKNPSVLVSLPLDGIPEEAPVKKTMRRLKRVEKELALREREWAF